MKASFKHLISFSVLCLFFIQAKAQLTGAIIVPGPIYATLDSVILDLNTHGVGPGGVLIQITAAQSAPAGGYVLGSTVLNATASATNPVVFNGNGNTVTAAAGVSNNMDAVFTIKGTDYLTIDGLNLTDPATNTTAITQMEWGYALLKQNSTIPYDGCQHVTIRNCVISLNPSNMISIGIYSNNHVPGSLTQLAATGAVSSDANSYNRFYGNTITAYTGIYLNGINKASVYDCNNSIGAPLGNKITFGGSTADAYGIFAANDSAFTVNNSSIVTAPGMSGKTYGIYTGAGSGSVTISNDTFRLANTGASNVLAAYYNAGNTDTNRALRFSGNHIGINYPSATAATVYGFYNNTLSFDSIKVINNTVDSVILGGMGNLNVFYNAYGTTPHFNFSGNAILKIRKPDIGTVNGFSVSSNATSGELNISNNYVSNVTVTGTVTGITINAGKTQPVNCIANKISDINVSAGTAGATGINITMSNATTFMGTLSNDTVRNIQTGTGTAYGININTATAGMNVQNNRISGLSTATGTVTGINTSGGNVGMELNVSGNNINNLSVSGASGTMYGINLGGGTAAATVTYNNMISGFSAPVYSGTAISGIYVSAGKLHKVFYNTVYLNFTSSGANLGATGINLNPGTVSATSGLLDLRNNIFNVNVQPAGTGIVAAFYKTKGTVNVSPVNLVNTSDGNILYAPNVANSYLYAEINTSNVLVNKFNLTNDPNFNQSCALFKSFLGYGYNNLTENNLVAAAMPASYNPGGISYAKGLAVPVNPSVTIDYAGVTRPNPADAGALQFMATSMPDILPPAISFTPLPQSSCLAAPVLNAAITDISGINTTAGTAPRIYYKKASETDSFGVYPGNNNSSFNGWKYAEATGTAPNFSFTIDYSKLTATPVYGDSITYFIVAQDNAATPNVATKANALAPGFCPSSVNLTAAAGPTIANHGLNGYKVFPLSVTITPASATTFCAGGSVVLQASAPAGVTYQWQLNNNNINAATDTAYTASAAGNYTVVISNGSCTATATVVPVVINSPSAIITPTGTTNICQGDTVRLRVLGGVGLTYQWQRNGNNINNATDTLYKAIANGIYNVVVSSSNCTSTSVTSTVVVNPLPNAIITYTGDTVFCQGDTLQLNATVNTDYTYQWLHNGIMINGAVAATYKAAMTGDYKVVIANIAGCTDTSFAVHVRVRPAPVPVISMNNGILTTGTLFTAYQWYLNGQPISGAVNPAYLMTQNGIYTVAVTDTNGCKAFATPLNVTNVGVNTINALGNNIKIYPNPANSVVYIDAPAKLNIDIMSLEGKLVLKEKAASEVNISVLADGMYIIRLTDENGNLVQIEKLIKNHE